MQVFPSSLLLLCAHLVILGVLEEVILKHAKEDSRQKASQQQHRHARVDDREPVDLDGEGGQESGCYQGIKINCISRKCLPCVFSSEISSKSA